MSNMLKCLIGYGGHAREIMAQMDERLPCFVDDEYICENSLPLSKFDPNKYLAMIAIGHSQKRKQMFEKLPANTKYFSFVHPSAQIMDNSIFIGEGSFVGANCILTTNIKIGDQAILNRGNHISHDCIIGDFFSAMPNSIISGNVRIGDIAYLGANSCIKEKINIHNNVIIGMNSGVIKDINRPGSYVGCPAKKI